MLEERGIKVLRLPKKHWEFNAINLLWYEIKKSIPKFPTESVKVIEEDVREAFARVSTGFP